MPNDTKPKGQAATKAAVAGLAGSKATRRPRGEPRRLLLDAARALFARQDYRSTTTKEIAERAGVLEHLLFRQFGSKAALFHEAVVVPFTQLVEDFSAARASGGLRRGAALLRHVASSR